MKSAQTNADILRARLLKNCREKDQNVKGSLRKGKREWYNSTTLKARNAAKLGQIQVILDVVGKVCNEPLKKVDTVRLARREGCCQRKTRCVKGEESTLMRY